LSMSLGEKADDLLASGVLPRARDHRLVDVLSRDEIENHRDKPCVLNPLVSTGRIVHCDSRPEHLADTKPACRRVETSVQLVDLVGQEAGDRGSEDTGKLGVKQMANRAVE